MIEVPRGALTADEIARDADFFSFGTNDLTQMTFGYSRDDAEGGFLLKYVEDRILPVNPFQTLDDAVAGLMKTAVDKGRATKPGLELGICGEHGGDPGVDLQVRADRARLRVLLAVPRAGRPARRGPGRARQRGRARQVGVRWSEPDRPEPATARRSRLYGLDIVFKVDGEARPAGLLDRRACDPAGRPREAPRPQPRGRDLDRPRGRDRGPASATRSSGPRPATTSSSRVTVPHAMWNDGTVRRALRRS